MRSGLIIIACLIIAACSSPDSAELETEVVLRGEMLFAGANTLQGSAVTVMDELASKLTVEKDDIRSVRVKNATVVLDQGDEGITESALLQIVSDGIELKSLGTFSPVEGARKLELSMAEDTDVGQYLNDEGATWVLDVNLSEDHLEEMETKAILDFIVEYKPKSK
jgi:uncharacterized protein YcfL